MVQYVNKKSTYRRIERCTTIDVALNYCCAEVADDMTLSCGDVWHTMCGESEKGAWTPREDLQWRVSGRGASACTGRIFRWCIRELGGRLLLD